MTPLSFRRVLEVLSSMLTGLVLFGLVGAVSVLGSVVPAWADAVYTSWWFLLLLGALVANTGLCTVRQFPRALKGSLRLKVLFLVHFSVLVIALGCLWGVFAFGSTTVSAHPGDRFGVGSESWQVASVAVQRYPDGSVSDWVTTVVTPAGKQEVRVNHPAESGEVKVLQSGYGRDFTVRLEAEGQSTDLQVAQDTEVPLTADGRVGLALSPPRDGLLAAAQDSPGQTRTVDLLLTSGGRILQKTAAFEGVPLTLGDTGLTVTVLESVPVTTLLVRRAPGLALVWAGLALLALSVTALMLLPRPLQEAPRA